MAKRKQNKKKSFFRENYKESWNYIKDSRKFIYAVIIIFLFFSLLGFFVPVPGSLEKQILKFIQDLLAQTKGMSQFELIKFIFFNNVQTSFTGIIFGMVLGAFPVIITLANGYLLGFVASKTVAGNGIFILWRLFPHGIFELPALFISLGLGLKMGTFLFQKDKITSFKSYLINSIKVFFLIVIPLFLIAAIIEGSLISLIG